MLFTILLVALIVLILYLGGRGQSNGGSDRDPTQIE